MSLTSEIDLFPSSAGHETVGFILLSLIWVVLKALDHYNNVLVHSKHGFISKISN